MGLKEESEGVRGGEEKVVSELRGDDRAKKGVVTSRILDTDAG